MKRFLSFLGIIFFTLNIYAQTDITADEIYQHIAFLASDSLKGRFPGTKECKIAANYIRQQFIEDGLTLLADSGFQYFQITTGAKLNKDNYLKINNKNYKLNTDFVPLAFSKSDKIKAKAVIVGYGLTIDLDTIKWDDYQNVSLKGKWAIIFRGKPQNTNIPEAVFRERSSEMAKIINAADHGAVGVIFITPLEQFKNDLIPFQMPRFATTTSIPAISVSHKVAEDIFQNVKITLNNYLKFINQRPMPWEELSATIEATVDVEPLQITTQNIVALLHSNDPVYADRYIVIGAHCDHLGMGGYGSGSRMPDTIAIHNGADDNASGVAGLLELAEFLAANRDKLKRSIIFISFGAEERGLLGSSFFVKHPLVPLDSIDLMINMDMIGKYGDHVSIMGTGTAKELADMIKNINYDTTKLKVKTFEKAYGGSDHTSFITAGVPALFFYASTAEDYHTPFDDVEKIRPQKEAEVVKYIAKLAIHAANYNGRTSFVKQEMKQSGKKYGTRVKLGIVPAFEDTGNKGLKISGVVDGKPAAKAGLTAGDIITEVNNKKIHNIYEYMEVLQQLKPNTKINVKVLRNNKQLSFDLEL